MKKLFLLLFGVLLFAGSFAGPPISEVDFDTGVYIEQPQDFEVIVDVSATELELDFLIVDYSIRSGDFGFSPGNRFVSLFIIADEAFNNQYRERDNYLYMEIERFNRPPNMEAKAQFSESNCTNSKDDYIKVMNKNILFGFWIC